MRRPRRSSPDSRHSGRIYSADGSLLAAYRREGEPLPPEPARPGDDTSRFESGRLRLLKSIRLETDVIGGIHMDTGLTAERAGIRKPATVIPGILPAARL